MATKKQMVDRIAKKVGKTGDSAAETIIGEKVNEVVGIIADEIDFPGLIKEGYLRIPDNDRFAHALNSDVGAIQGPMLVEGTTSRIWPLSLSEFMLRYPNPSTAAGTPKHYIPLGKSAVYQQPETAIRLASSSSSDTNVVVTIPALFRGLRRDITVTLNGTTGVLSDCVEDIVGLPTASPAPVGTITATANSTVADATLPIVATAGAVTVFTIGAGVATAGATTTTSPGSILRMHMLVDDSTDYSKEVSITGIGIEHDGTDYNEYQQVERTITMTTHASDSTTVITYPTTDTGFRFTRVQSVSLNWDNAQTFVLKSDPEQVITRIPPGKRSVEYNIYGFHPIPDLNKNIVYMYNQDVDYVLQNDPDEPPIDAAAHKYVEKWAGVLMRDHIGSRKGTDFIRSTQEFREDMNRLRDALMQEEFPRASYGENSVNRFRHRFGSLPWNYEEVGPYGG